MAQSMALDLHELMTNALKYGALSVAMGQVQVEWSRAANGQFLFRWAGSGGPAVRLPSHRGFGTTVIEQIKQLNGEVRFDWRKERLCAKSPPIRRTGAT
jgi:two-component sensor histidine kinase